MTFKLILTGVTGRIGGEVLQQSLRDPAITSIVALTRRALPELASFPKLDVVVVKDFKQYSDEVIAKLAGADGCIWCMTTTAGDPVLELEYPKAFAEAFLPALAKHEKRFRYLHVTGAVVEPDQSQTLWLKGSMRKTKGQAEVQMMGFAQDPTSNGLWETIIARPGGVVKQGSIFANAASLIAGSSGWAIRSDELALALIDAVATGSDEPLLRPQALLKRAQELAKKREIESNPH